MIQLSIIIPHYNSVYSLKKLLKTIPKHKEIQVIIVDDNSDLEYRKELLDLSVEKSGANIEIYNNNSGKKGAGACRNIGINKANGEWFLFADADDYFTENFFNSIGSFLKTENDVVFFTPTSIEIDTGKVSDRHLQYTKIIKNYMSATSRTTENLIRYTFFVPWSKLIKASLVKEKGIYFDEVLASNDVMFSTKLGYHMKNFEVSEKIIYCVTRSKGSLTTTINENIFNSRLVVAIEYYHFLKQILNKYEFKSLNLSGRGLIIQARKFGIKKMVYVYLRLKRNKVHIIDRRIFNLKWIYKSIYIINKNEKRLKNYYK